jgi:hypothetical protein
MAKVDVLHTPKDALLFYNLDAAVGKASANRKDDVLLVQYLLKTSANVPGKFEAIVGGAVKQLPGVWTDYDDMLLGMVQNYWKDKGTSTWQDRAELIRHLTIVPMVETIIRSSRSLR